jgi:FAD/FMN-containing dehydrogenase
MRRRSVLSGTAAIIALQAALPPRLQAQATAANVVGRVRPGMPGWPGEADWAALNQAVGGRLSPVALPNFADPAVHELMADPFYLQDHPGLTESSGWLDAWRSSASRYVVAAESAADVAAAVRFASVHNLRLVLKGTGHSFFGASNAPDSLLVWTRRMNAITIHDSFVPQGSGAAGVPAVSVGAGAIWLHVYQAVTVGAGRYAQGGGCTTVGVAGLVQGGGFGSFSKAYGTTAASLIEAELVTADGVTRVVNSAREPDLFWALKGGGGGTFGVVTRLTLATHPLPETFGSVRWTLHAHSDEAYRRLLARFVSLYATGLFNPHWGEQVRVRPDNRFEVQMMFQGLTQEEARAAWQPLIDFVTANAADYEGQDSFVAQVIPARRYWSAELYRQYAPWAVTFDARPGASPTDFCWRGDTGQVGAFWDTFASAWLPASLLQPQNQARLVDALFAASRHWQVELPFNKGIAGAPTAAIEATRNTAMNPDVVDAFALAIIASYGSPAFPGFPAPDLATGAARRARVQAAMTTLRAAAPDTGAYVNECDYFQPDWQRAFWGWNYPRLADIKRRYDPDGLFFVHHGVGSEAWSADGFTRLT